jgi:tetratricopeptide (TPR) repeat protein
MRGRPRAALLALLAGASLLGGCVYYNGMYNTNRLAKSARKAERDGRVFEARNLWGQVITRAESLVVRHPRSKYADEANVLRGLALARLDQCPTAVGPLGRVTLLHKIGDLSEESSLALGRCQIELGDAALADLAFVRVIDSHDPARRREARFQHARALRLTGRYEEALAILRENPDSRAGSDLLLSLAASGRGDEALALSDSLLASKDTAFVWDSVIATLGRLDPRVASKLVDRVQSDPRASPELRAARLYEDAVRLADVDTARSVARLQQAAAMAGRTDGAERARLKLLRVALSRARTLDDLGPHTDSLAALVTRGGAAAPEAVALQAGVSRVRGLADSATPGVPRGDLRLFLGAEAARDAVGAPALAAGLFRRLADEWPASPYAPKALLAADRLVPAAAEDARTRLDSLYPDSPYLAVLRGEDPPAYRTLEDSLQAFALTQAQVGRRPLPASVRRRLLEEGDKQDPARRRDRRPADDDTARPRRGLEP